MLSGFSKKIAFSLFEKDKRYPIEVYIYGVELLISSLTGTLFILIEAVLFNALPESIIYLISLAAVRVFTGGYHAETYLKCNIITVLSFTFSLLVYKLLSNYLFVCRPFLIAFVFLISVILFVKYSPMENEYKPIAANDIMKYKIISLVILTIISAINVIGYILNKEITVIMLFSLLVEDIAMIVKLIKDRRQKYEEFER
ncbi:MAG: accessory gene regulator B family protein [Clostridiales bacterium]|nr:accessory gene regulator B family protein [Clostridiales bacterium]